MIDRNVERLDKVAANKSAKRKEQSVKFEDALYLRWHENMLVLQDPASPINDLGSKCWRIEEVLQTWRTLSQASHKARRSWARKTPEDLLAEDRSILDPLLTGAWNSFVDRRNLLLRLRRPKKASSKEATSSGGESEDTKQPIGESSTAAEPMEGIVTTEIEASEAGSSRAPVHATDEVLDGMSGVNTGRSESPAMDTHTTGWGV